MMGPNLLIRRTRFIFFSCVAVGIALAIYYLLRQYRSADTLTPDSTVTRAMNEMEERIDYFPVKNTPQPRQKVQFDDFVGTERCIECHEAQYARWSKSAHGLAGSLDVVKSLPPNFQNLELRFSDAVVRTAVTEDSASFNVMIEGFELLTYTIDYTIGKNHIYGGGAQAFFSKGPDGRLMFLPFEYNEDKGWFCQSSSGWRIIDGSFSIDDALEWPVHRPLGALMDTFTCQQCHGSQIELNSNERSGHFETNIKSGTINCESCHGPGKQHVDIVSSPGYENSEDIGIGSLATIGKDESLQVCFRCHAVKKKISRGQFLPGDDFELFFALRYPFMDIAYFHPDGRTKSYTYTKPHLSSDCYLNGSMTCVDCHDPHRLDYRDIWARPLEGRFDDGQCLDCHASKFQDLERHTFHPLDSEGSRCVACHMPFIDASVQKVRNDPNLIDLHRSDHTISIPRPGIDETFRITNACSKSKCHDDLTFDEIKQAYLQWYGTIKPHKAVVQELMNYQGRWQLDFGQLDQYQDHPTALLEMLRIISLDHVDVDVGNINPVLEDQLKLLTKSDNIDIKSFSTALLYYSLGNKVKEFLATVLSDSGHDEAKIRARWAVILKDIASIQLHFGKQDKAVKTLKKVEEITDQNDNISRAYLYLDLGSIFKVKNDHQKAEVYFWKAHESGENDHRIQSRALDALGQIYEETRRKHKAVVCFQRAIEKNPFYYNGYKNLAEIYLELGKEEAAARTLKNARNAMPNDARILYLGKEIFRQSKLLDLKSQ